MGKLLILVGIALIVIGLLLTFKISIPFLGRLPGDISISGNSYSVYIPITTCIVISIVLSILMYLFSRH